MGLGAAQGPGHSGATVWQVSQYRLSMEKHGRARTFLTAGALSLRQVRVLAVPPVVRCTFFLFFFFPPTLDLTAGCQQPCKILSSLSCASSSHPPPPRTTLKKE